MINYSLKYSTSEIGRIFSTDTDIIKKWKKIFAEYLSPAPSGPNIQRDYTISDIRVFAYIDKFWEDKPDLLSIRNGLNSCEHFGYDDIDNLISELIPIFTDMPDNFDETWQGVVFGGEFNFGEHFDIAESFMLAGDRLVEAAVKHDEERSLFQAIVYNYRHATELYIKSVIGSRIEHRFSVLYPELKKKIQTDFSLTPPQWFENFILAFHDIDPNSTTFRYGDNLPDRYLYGDIQHIRKIAGYSATVFRRIKSWPQNRSLANLASS